MKTSSSPGPDTLGPSNDKAFALLKVKSEFDSFRESKTTINGMPPTVVTVDAKGDSGTMKLTLASLEVTKDKGLMFIQCGGESGSGHQDLGQRQSGEVRKVPGGA